MTPLPTKFSGRADQRGFEFEQIERVGNIAIYRKTKPGQKVVVFEVVRILIRKAEKAFQRDYPNREVYPKSEFWGLYGWTECSVEHARRRLAIAQSTPFEGFDGKTVVGDL